MKPAAPQAGVAPRIWLIRDGSGAGNRYFRPALIFSFNVSSPTAPTMTSSPTT
jgi:hypothetical protein